MRAVYKRELEHNYLVLEQEKYEPNYQVGMLIRNRIPGLLPCAVSRLDGSASLYYEITSRQSLRLLLERKRLSVREFLKLLEGIHSALQSCEEYLLDVRQLLLLPEYIYLDPDEWTVFLCLFPFEEPEEEGGLSALAEYLLEHLDRQDSLAVTLGYEFYRMAGEENPSLGSFLEAWKEENGQELPEKKTLLYEGMGEQTSLEESCLRERFDGQDEPVFSEWTEETQGGTACLTKSRDPGLFLRSQSAAYPDLRVTKESFLIGKKKDAVDAWLKARGISRIHSKISREEDCFYLTDLNSTNGTFLNGGRLEVHEKARLRPGDCVGFADVKYVVEG